ncbi:MAG: hypothetical protein OSB57_07605, partial [Planctomycetota bacterium]|nr:hypothetical protein [Planctomycetota bacterium]
MRLLSTPLLALCATTLLSSPLLGQTPDRSVGRLRTAIMERLDTDGDGNISAEEAQAGRKALKERGGIQALPEPIRNAIIKRFNKNDDVKGTDGRPGVKGNDKRSDAKGTDRRPGVKGVRPEGQSSGLGHL